MAMTRVQRAAAALRNLLTAHGTVGAFAATRLVCQSERCSRHDVRRAAEQLGVIAVTVRGGVAVETDVGGGGLWSAWRLPEDPNDQRWTN